jgi:hypothetical protein
LRAGKRSILEIPESDSASRLKRLVSVQEPILKNEKKETLYLDVWPTKFELQKVFLLFFFLLLKIGPKEQLKRLLKNCLQSHQQADNNRVKKRKVE